MCIKDFSAMLYALCAMLSGACPQTYSLLSQRINAFTCVVR
jgi:hypothetical protein